jgi:uncharacterized protein (DUF885 family)
MMRAVRLVVDTGIHAKRWTRDEGIKFIVEHTGVAEQTAADEVDRYSAMPAQALGYKIGSLEIARLRQSAETELGSRLSVRDFHSQVLSAGALPLNLLDKRIQRWIATQNE